MGVEDDDPYNDPAHWYEDEDDFVDSQFPQEYAYQYWKDDTEEQKDFTAFVSAEWAKKYDVVSGAGTALEAGELECVSCLHTALGPDCCEDPDTIAEFV